MQRMRSIITLAVILGLTVFGVSQFYIKTGYQKQLEASYQRAFRELSVHINHLETELAKLQVANSATQRADILANILRLVYAAQANLGQLPITGVSLSRIENLLAQAQSMAVNTLRENTVSSPDLQMRTTKLYQQLQYLNSGLQSELQKHEQSTSWVSWKNYLQTSITRSSNIEPGERYPLMQALVMLEDGMERFSDSDFASELSRLKGPLPQGDPITQQQAVEIAQSFLPMEVKDNQLTVTANTTGELPTYTVSTTVNQAAVTLEIAQNGGHVLWMTNSRSVNQSLLSMAEMLEHAQRFLTERGFPELALVGTDTRFNRMVCSFVVVDKDVLIYPRQLKVQVAADNGEIVGFQGLTYHSYTELSPHQPTLTVAEAQAKLAANTAVVEQHLALILNDNFTEVLTYQFRVNYGDDQFLIYINADTGVEEKIIRVEPQESISW